MVQLRRRTLRLQGQVVRLSDVAVTSEIMADRTVISEIMANSGKLAAVRLHAIADGVDLQSEAVRR